MGKRNHMNDKNRALTPAQRLRKILTILRKRFPADKSYNEVDFVDALIAIVLSQNTSDVNSHRAYQMLRATYPTWEEVAEADPGELAEVIRVGGLADQKSRTIIATLAAFKERWGDYLLEGIHETSDEDLIGFLTAINGVGVKSATCAMMFSLDRDLCAVDTHIHRVINRLGIVRASSPDKTFRELRPMIPKGAARELHVGLIHFGRQICKARNPHCFECPLYTLCEWEEKEAYAAARKQGPKPVSGDFLIADAI